MTAVEWLFEKLWQLPKDKFTWYNALEQAKEMEKQQIIDAYDKNKMGRVNYGEQYYNETYGSKGSDKVEKSEKPILLYNKLKKVADFWHGSEIPKPIFKQYLSDNNLNEIVTSPQTEISEYRFREIDVRFAYMQGYNRGKDNNPNHMESYIQHLKSTKSPQTEISINELKGICQSVIDNTPSDATEKEIGYTKAMEHIIKIIDGEPHKYPQTEISDEEIEKSALEFFADYKGGASQWEISAFIMGMKKYREQLKSKQ